MKTTASTIRWALALSATTIAIAAQAGQRDYIVQDLGISVKMPMAMNNLGQMVGNGYFDAASGQWVDQAWVVSPTTGLKNLGLPTATAVGINDQGAIVGRIWPDNGKAGFVIQNGITKYLPYPDNALTAQINAISPTNQIVGMTADPKAGGNDLTRYVKRRPTVSKVLIGNVNSGACTDGEGVAINAAGQVAATVTWEAARIEADNTYTWFGAGYASRADAINRHGDVAGIDFHSSAFVYADGALTWLPKPDWASNGFSVRAMNDKRQVVGGGSNGGECNAFVWSASGGLTNLNKTPGVIASGLHLEYAFGIDKTGQIAAQATNAAGQSRLVFLTPR